MALTGAPFFLSRTARRRHLEDKESQLLGRRRESMKFPKLNTTWRHGDARQKKKKSVFCSLGPQGSGPLEKPYSCWVDVDRDNSRQQCASPALATQAHAFLQDALYK